MPKFSEIPYFILKNYADEVIDAGEPSVPESASGGILFRANSTFLTKNTNPFQLFKKGEGEDYTSIKATITSDWDEEPDNIKLRRLFTKNLTPTDDILRTVTLSGYQRITYDTFAGEDYLYDINNGDEMFVRKDSLFHDWFNQTDDYKGFSNPEKLFLYIGQGYKEGNFINIPHYALKNWMINALPYNNRNDTLNEFLYVLYDQLYHKVFEMQKNIFSLFDPFEIATENIRDISLIYNEPPLESDITEFKRRVYVDNLINWLKKKGTYSALYAMWYILTKDTGNVLTIYDGWHPKLTSGSPEDDITYYDYTKFYTSSSSADYPRTYTLDPSGNVLSTHYKVEFGICNNPFGDKVLSKELMNDLYNKWENSRPVTRYANYHLLAEIETDFSGELINLYEDPIYDANIYSGSTLFTEASSAAAIHVQSTASPEWIFEHDLDSEELLVHVYNLNLERIFPDTIEMASNTSVRITFPEFTSGSAFLVKADYVRTQNFLLNSWTINHLLNNRYVLSQMYQDELVEQVISVEAVDSNTLQVETVGLSGYGYIAEPDYTHMQVTKDTTWTISHNLGYIGVMLDIYDGNNEKVYPDSITLTDINTCKATFTSPTSGYVGVRAAGNPSLGGDVSGKFDEPFIIKLGNGTDLDDWDYVAEGDVKSLLYTHNCPGGSPGFTVETDGVRFKFQIPREVEGYITELAIFNDEGDLSWISKIDDLYKHEDVLIDFDFYAQFEDL